MSATPENPGSYKSYVGERSHPSVLTDELELRRRYNDELTRYREDLAVEKGVTLETLHGLGVAVQQVAEIVATQEVDTVAEAQS